MSIKNYWDEIKNKFIYADVPNGLFFSESMRVFKHGLVENIILEMQEELDKFKFIECCICGENMELINNNQYGCCNEDCNNIQNIKR